MRGETDVTTWIWAVGRLLGLSTSAGLRASMTLLVMGVLSREGWGFHLPSQFSWLESSIAIGVLVVLAILEIAFDKMPSVDRIYSRLTVPWRLAAGAIAGAAALSHGWLGFGVGLAAGAGLAYLTVSVKQLWRPRSTTSTMTIPLLSLLEDLAAFLSAVLSATLPPVGYAVAAWVGWFDVRLRRRRVAKYKGLRVLSR
jgi:uncharacterized membrane protein